MCFHSPADMVQLYSRHSRFLPKNIWKGPLVRLRPSSDPNQSWAPEILPRILFPPAIRILAALVALVPQAHARERSSVPRTSSAVEPVLDLMPVPANVKLKSGRLAVTTNFSVAVTGSRDRRVEDAVKRFLDELSRLTGLPLPSRTTDVSNATLVIQARRASKPIPQLDEDETYTLDTDASKGQLTAANSLGVLRGLQTFLQLVAATEDGFSVPAVHIEDRPRFPWRGLMIDSSRHFIPVEAIERALDAMEAVKLNVFHWHLSDNQGFRVESRTFPKLQELGSDGLFYTQAEVGEVIAYASARGIRVIPEFDIPGHTTSWFVGYPELASAPGPYLIEREWGIFDPAMDPTRDSTYRFLEKFIAEMARLFPDAYFHIGGDEVNGKQWEANPAIQSFMKTHGLKTTLDLQHYFNGRVNKILEQNHKIMIGWDEILAPGLPIDTVIQSWRGQESLAAAARQGYRGVLSYGYYLDLMWSAAQHYAVDPLGDGAANLSPELSARILGGEACLWTEFVSSENMDSRIWPRTAAIAERLWSPATVQDALSMYRRLDGEDWRLEMLDFDQHRPAPSVLLDRLAGPNGGKTLEVLASVVEPVKGYTREHMAMAARVPLTSADPLNRLVDAVPPESEAARKFGEDVDALIASRFSDGARESRMRSLLRVWQSNDRQLQPQLGRSFLLEELSALSEQLAKVASVGLAALDTIDRGEPADLEQLERWTAVLRQAEIPSRDLLLVIAPEVEKLVRASALSQDTGEAGER
jgi:hexosaminidase